MLRRSLTCLLTVFLLLPGLPAAADSPVCPAAIPAAGYTDLAGLSAEAVAAVDCLAFTGITRGTTPNTFTPRAAVTRWEMALFLTRQLEIQGVSLPSGAPQGFTDLEGLTTEAVTAVNQLAQLGVTRGTGPTTFSPYTPVTRWQMALFLKRSLIAAGVPVPVVDQGPFTDLEGLTTEAVTAVDQLAQLGVTQGTGPTTFSPYTPVTRWQMALFLVRSLHTAGFDIGRVGVVHAVDKTADTLSFAAFDGTFSVSGLTYGTATRWRVDGAYTTKADFEARLTVGDRLAWRQAADEIWLDDAPFQGTPAARTGTGFVTVTLDSGSQVNVNYQAKNLPDLGVAVGVGGAVKYVVGGSGASTTNLGLWEAWVDDIIAGRTTGTVRVDQVGVDVVWTVTTSV